AAIHRWFPLSRLRACTCRTMVRHPQWTSPHCRTCAGCHRERPYSRLFRTLSFLSPGRQYLPAFWWWPAATVQITGTAIRMDLTTVSLQDHRMCNLYNLTTNQEAMRRLFAIARDHSGNLEPSRDVYPDQPAPVIRLGADGGRELAPLVWGMP